LARLVESPQRIDRHHVAMQPDPRTEPTRYPTSQDPWGTTAHVPPPGQPTQPQQFRPQHVPPRKSNRGLIIAVIALAVLLGIGTLISLALLGANPPAAHTVRFEVTSSSGQVTLINWSTLEDSAILNDTASPWTLQVEMESRTGLVGVNASTASGTVACKLWVDGKLADDGESAGTVHCGATVR
jgi:hypothetical protein